MVVAIDILDIALDVVVGVLLAERRLAHGVAEEGGPRAIRVGLMLLIMSISTERRGW